MAIYRKGVKVGKYDIRTGVTKKRAQALLRKLKVLPDDKGRKKFEKDARGEVQLIRTVVGKAEGFTKPANFMVRFKAENLGIDQQRMTPYNGAAGSNGGMVQTGSLDWQTHIMNKSEREQFLSLWSQAQMSASFEWRKTMKKRGRKADRKMDLFCSKVTIPEKMFNQAPVRTYGHTEFRPQQIQYGTLTTEFYCDGTMQIKTFFDAWQKLIYNDLTGNFNFYNEYCGEFDIFTRKTMATGASVGGAVKPDNSGLAGDISNTIKEGTAKLNELTGMDGPRDGNQAENKIPETSYRENYGVRIFKCWPQMVSGIDLAHDAGGDIARFTVTWMYEKWSPFKIGNVGNRNTINLAVGEFRNEKDGFPFLEDLPEELAGPLTGAVNQGIVTGPLSKGSNLLG